MIKSVFTLTLCLVAPLALARPDQSSQRGGPISIPNAQQSPTPAAADFEELKAKVAKYGVWAINPDLADSIDDPVAALQSVCDLLQQGRVYQAYFDHKKIIDRRCQNPERLLHGLALPITQVDFAEKVLLQRLFKDVKDGHLQVLVPDAAELGLVARQGISPDWNLEAFFNERLGQGLWSRVTVQTFEGFGERLLGEASSCKDLVLDFRGNAGGNGSDEKAFVQMMQTVLGKELPPSAIPKFQSIQNIWWLAGAMGDEGGDQSGFDAAVQDFYTSHGPGPFERTGAWDALYGSEDEESEDADVSPEETAWKLALEQTLASAREKFPQPFQKKIYAVVDATCASSCELALLYLRAMHGSHLVTVGQPTRGAVRYGDAVPYGIPGTRVVLRLANSVLDIKHFPELSGLRPQIKIPAHHGSVTSRKRGL